MSEEMKNPTEQLPLLKVHMMGSFFLEYGDQPISFRKTMATKSMRLLQIFLYNKDNGISRGRLLESTYGREDVADAANSLRVRNTEFLQFRCQAAECCCFPAVSTARLPDT